jgi:tyrosine-protein phosphatase YwqE
MSLFNLFKRKNQEPDYPPLTDFSAFNTDIHSHLIPGIDDGVKTIEESLDLIRTFIQLGFKKLVTTPHIMSDAYHNTPEIIFSGLETLRRAAADAGLSITLEAAAEYYVDERLMDMLKNEKLLTLNGKYLLFEISYVNLPANLYEIIFKMIEKGYTPVLAHPERYPFWLSKFDEYEKLKDAGVLFQLNTNSLCGYYGTAVKKMAERLVDALMVDFIGSDMHGQRHMNALKNMLSEKYLWKLATLPIKNRML